MPGLSLILGLACTLPPTATQVRDELAVRRDRSEPPMGSCWTRDRLFGDGDPSLCVPGPWFDSASEFGAFLDEFSPWWKRQWEPDELLVLGTTLIHSGEPIGLMIGVRMQIQALEDSPSPAVVARMEPYRLSAEQIWTRQTPDSLVYGTGLLVLEQGGWRERLGWARIRENIDRQPTPSAAEWEALAPMDRSPEAVMWPSLSHLEEDLLKLDAAWQEALAASPAR